MLARLVDGTKNLSTKRLMFQAFSFIISYRLRALKTIHFNFCKTIENNKINRNYFCKELQENMKMK